MTLRLGYCGSHEQWPAPRLVELAAAAERAGFDAAWVSDHFHPWQDNQGHAGHAWITLATMAQQTTRLTLGTGVTCPTYRFRPAEVAHAFASLAAFAPGRIFLGVGTGEALNELPAGGGWGPYRERAERLVEAIDIIRRLWTGNWVSHRGTYYAVEGAKLYDPPPAPVPIYVAASGPKSLALAGTYGDGLITDPGTARDPEKLAIFTEAARKAGKDPAALPKLVELYVTVGTRQDALAVAPLWQFGPAAGKLVNLPDPREIERRAMTLTTPDEVISRWVVSEDPEVHVAALRELETAGVTDVYIHSAQPDQQAVIDFYAKQVRPRI
ncbi:MAG: TIGR03557 family F420-dependent LLM class oxidoreductase [Dehalococcoidia bacterium]